MPLYRQRHGAAVKHAQEAGDRRVLNIGLALRIGCGKENTDLCLDLGFQAARNLGLQDPPCSIRA